MGPDKNTKRKKNRFGQSWAEIREGNRRQQELRNAARKLREKSEKPYQKVVFAKPLAHPISKAKIKRPDRPISKTPTLASDQRVGTGSQTGTQPIVAKPLAHPQRRIPSDNRLGYDPARPTFNGNGTKSDAPPMPRSKAGYKPAHPGIATKPTPTLTISTQSAPAHRPAAAKAKLPFGQRFKAALKHSAQTQKIKALQRQHKAARSG